MTETRAPGGSIGYADQHRFGRVMRIPTPTPFPVGDINSYLIEDSTRRGELTLIDTGVKSPAAFDALRKGFKEYGYSLEQVRRILVTHAHMDHYGQALRLREISGATVYASELEAERMMTHWSPSAQRDERILAAFERWGVPPQVARSDAGMSDLSKQLQDPMDVDVVLGEGDRVEIGDWTLEVMDTPGHCEGHIVFYERDTRVLFSGDHLLTDISPVPLLSFPKREGEPRPKSLARFMESLVKVEALDCAITFPSHGDVILDHRKLIAGYRLHHERRALQLARMLAAGPRTAFELASQMFPRHYATQLFLVLSEVIGHLDILVDEGTVRIEEKAGVEYARLARPCG
jgi:glyoxylase-like metal-dependent hydrolase (beta-lactamase superfamily II)